MLNDPDVELKAIFPDFDPSRGYKPPEKEEEEDEEEEEEEEEDEETPRKKRTKTKPVCDFHIDDIEMIFLYFLKIFMKLQ